MKNIRKTGLAFALLLISSLSHAQLAVFDASAFGQLIEQVNELEKTYGELQTQGTHIKSAIEGLSNGSYQWSNNELLSLMTQLNNVMERNHAIAYSSSSLDSQFATYFPGYVGTVSGKTYQQQYQENTNNTLSTINNALASIGMNMNDLSSESSRLDSIHTHVQGAVGQTQALQALSEVNEELVTQTQSLRQIVSAQANSESVYFAQQVQKEASNKANMNNVIAAGSTEEVSYGSNPDDVLHVPY